MKRIALSLALCALLIGAGCSVPFRSKNKPLAADKADRKLNEANAEIDRLRKELLQVIETNKRLAEEINKGASKPILPPRKLCPLPL